MTYLNAVKYIKAHKGGIPSPERMRVLCRYLGDPQRQMKYVHFAGSSGRSSCAYMLASVLNEAGYRVGRLAGDVAGEAKEFISTDNNISISHTEFAECIGAVSKAAAQMINDVESCAEIIDETTEQTDEIYRNRKPKITKNLMEKRIPAEPVASEIICAAAFLAFLNHNCNVVILECGDSRADPTGIIDPPLATVICGNKYTAEQLRTAVGTVRKGTHEVVCSSLNGDIHSSVLDACVKTGARLTVPAYGELTTVHKTLGGIKFDYRGKEYSISSFADYTQKDALTVIEASYALKRSGVEIHNENIVNGLNRARIPLCFEVFSVYPSIIIDGSVSDNDPSLFFESLRSAVLYSYIGRELTVISEKEINCDLNSMITDKGFVIKEVLVPQNAVDFKTAAAKAAKAPKEDTVVVIGSLSFCKNIKEALKKKLSF